MMLRRRYLSALTDEERNIFHKLSARSHRYLIAQNLKPEKILAVSPEQLVFENNPSVQSRSFFANLNGKENYSLKSFHIYPILKDYVGHGEKYVRERFSSYSYCKFYQYLNSLGEVPDPLHPGKTYCISSDDEMLWKKFLKLTNLYNQIKAHGYLKQGHEKDYILTKKTGNEDEYEVLSGHHRATILLLLDYGRFPVAVVEKIELN